MKKLLSKAYLSLSPLSRLKSTLSVLKDWFDPAVEGSPYAIDRKIVKTIEKQRSFFIRRKLSWR